MKYLKTYEASNQYVCIWKKVFWIVPLDKRFEDAVVRTMIQYNGSDTEVGNISVISDALEFCNNIRESSFSKGEKYLYFGMRFEYDDDNKLILSPQFQAFKYSEDLETLKDNDWIFLGYINCDKEEVDIYGETKKFNL